MLVPIIVPDPVLLVPIIVPDPGGNYTYLGPRWNRQFRLSHFTLPWMLKCVVKACIRFAARYISAPFYRARWVDIVPVCVV